MILSKLFCNHEFKVHSRVIFVFIYKKIFDMAVRQVCSLPIYKGFRFICENKWFIFINLGVFQLKIYTYRKRYILLSLKLYQMVTQFRGDQ